MEKAQQMEMETAVCENNEMKRNGSGYIDDTANKAIKNLDNESERFYNFLNIIFKICKLSGFYIENRLVVRDCKTGRIWK